MSVCKSDVIRSALAEIVGPTHVLTGTDMAGRFDGYPQNHAITALCVVRPADANEVAAILRYCHEHRVGVVPQGGRTGLCGGARAHPEEIALSLERMNTIEHIDDSAGIMVVQAGVQLQRVQEAAEDAGLLYPVDLGARGSATIGGNISTNAGGNSVLRYGMTRDQILGLEVVLADGTILSSMNRMMKNNAGFDLKQMFIGSEGTLGIVTRAVVRLRPRSSERATAWLGLSDFASVLGLLKLLRGEADGALDSFEVMWPEYVEVVLGSGKHRRPLDASHPFYVLTELSSGHSADTLDAAIAKAWQVGLILDATIASSEAQANALWAIRDDYEALVQRHDPLFLYDISLPQHAMADYVERLRTSVSAIYPGSLTMVFGHIADGNLHICIGGAGDETDHEAVSALVYDPLEALGGSISAEHGIGLEKRSYLNRSRSSDEIMLMRTIKQALDPRGILNRGKIFAVP